MEAVLREITVAVSEPIDRPDLAGGNSGLALLHAYLEAAHPGAGHGARALALLEKAIEDLGAKVMGPGLYGGFTGIAWTVDQLQSRLGMGEEDLNESIDEALLSYLDVAEWKDDYDLISGLVGYGVYALGRLQHPHGQAIAMKVLDHLDAIKVPGPKGVGWTWATAPELLPAWQREHSPNGYYNMGLAHGVPGVIAMLGHYVAEGVAPERSRALLEGAVTWLLSEREREGLGYCFPTTRSIGVEDREIPSRVAWCYGDLGLAVALLIAGRGASEPAWEAAALEVARHSAARRLANSGAADSGLCHGHAGNGHLFNRLWQATGDMVFADAARFWFEEALKARVPGTGVGGFRAFMPGLPGATEADPWISEPGLLEGATGIALAIAAGLRSVVPSWDRMLLVDVPLSKNSHSIER
jgi:lantibiotic modifying enzyme